MTASFIKKDRAHYETFNTRDGDWFEETYNLERFTDWLQHKGNFSLSLYEVPTVTFSTHYIFVKGNEACLRIPATKSNIKWFMEHMI